MYVGTDRATSQRFVETMHIAHKQSRLSRQGADVVQRAGSVLHRILQGRCCLSHCYMDAKRHHEQDNSYKKKHLDSAILQVQSLNPSSSLPSKNLKVKAHEQDSEGLINSYFLHRTGTVRCWHFTLFFH